MAWQPQQEPLAQLSRYLQESIGSNAAAQRNAEQMLRQAKTSPDINNYLAYICATPTPPPGISPSNYHIARSASAIMLKNQIKSDYGNMADQNKTFVKSSMLGALRDDDFQIRSFAGLAITEIIKQGGILNWKELLPELVALAANESGQFSPKAQDGAAGALCKVCEDNRRSLETNYPGEGRPLDFLLPKLMLLTNCSEAKVRSRALAALNMFLSIPVASTVRENIVDILRQVVQLTTDNSDEVRRYVCRAFAHLADSMPQVLIPHLQGIVDYVLSQQKEQKYADLALDAAEFFFEATSNDTLRSEFGPYLDRIVPVLVECMVYSEEDQMRIEAEAEDDAQVEDEAKDIKPQFATSKRTKRQTKSFASDDLSEGEIEDDDDIDPEDEWNLRKCSAGSLDCLADEFGGQVFDVCLPWLKQNLTHSEWPMREAAVLTLGAIGPGCMASISQHLPNLIPYMTSLLNDPQPVVRQISCWALSRYAGWASSLDAAGKQQFFEPMMEGIMKCMLDKNKMVQQSAASAFGSLEEAAGEVLAPYCPVIVPHLARCFQQYKEKNMTFLYECVQMLAENVGGELVQLTDPLMQALLGRWEIVPDESREIFPLLECIAYVAGALGPAFAPYARPIFMRCVRIISNNLQNEESDKDFLVTSLDLMSSTLQALETRYSTELAVSAQPNMFELMVHCMQDSSDDVRQSAYALLGDCAICVYPQLQPYLPTVFKILIQKLDLTAPTSNPETTLRVINNACWSCGEIAIRSSSELQHFVDELFQRLATIMVNQKLPPALNQNAAMALGKIGISCHQRLAPRLQDFAAPYLDVMHQISWTEEKGAAYGGFALVVLDNPRAMEQCLLNLLIEIAQAPDDVLLQSAGGETLKVLFERVLGEFKGLVGANWGGLLASGLPPAERNALSRVYGALAT
ncbi:ARM repeat-containing protein [Piedraia hortae CBS 480.64]|uniref:ARM repeat-containing protein n=1 Tax=Piedraia hortae CBS 480.64 TaxID=1314780 RepID=A0A6A7BZN9_9PEZI|nr:ARM repeat-containing protein [Piedraia hortae CBS 480.64]